VVLAGVVGVMSVSTSAYAASQEFNERYQTIAHNPTAYANSCVTRPVDIPDWYTYHWYLVWENRLTAERNVRLAPGGYTWTDCIYYDEPYTYYHISKLDPDNSSYATAQLDELDYEPHDNGSTTAYWGSTLAP
jgi:hypothetical protein